MKRTLFDIEKLLRDFQRGRPADVNALAEFLSNLAIAEPNGRMAEAAPMGSRSGARNGTAASTMGLVNQMMSRKSYSVGSQGSKEAAPSDEWGSVVDFWARWTERRIELGTPVSVTSSGIAKPAKIYGETASRMMPVGAVQEIAGNWVRVRNRGMGLVRYGDFSWPVEKGGTDLWMSDDAEGCCSRTMPRTSRNDIVRLGHKTGQASGNLVQAFIHPIEVGVFRQTIWEHDAENYIDREFIVIAGGGYWRLVFCCGGRVAAHLDDEAMKLASGVQEGNYTTVTALPALDSKNGEIEYVAASSIDPALPAIAFSVPDPGTGVWTLVAELTSTGVLGCGEFQENGGVIPAADAVTFGGMKYVWEAGAKTALDLSLDGIRSWMRFVRTSVGGYVNARCEVPEVWEDAI